MDGLLMGRADETSVLAHALPLGGSDRLSEPHDSAFSRKMFRRKHVGADAARGASAMVARTRCEPLLSIR